MKTGIAQSDPACARGPLHLRRGDKISDLLWSLLVVGHPACCTPVSPPIISIIASGPEALDGKNNIRLVDRQPNCNIKPKHRDASFAGQYDHHVHGVPKSE